MEFYTELRLRGDSYNNGYGNGITLTQSETVRNMKKVSGDESQTVFETESKIKVTVSHKKTAADQKQNAASHDSKNEEYG